MRFAKLTALCLAIALAWSWTTFPDPFGDPLHLHAQSAKAQPGIFGPGGVIHYTASSSSAVNSVVSVNLYDYLMAQPLVATTSYTSVAGTVSTLNVVAASVPMHLHCNGKLSTNSSPGAANVAVAFGPSGGTNAALFASVPLVNGITLPASLAQQPMTIDVWIAPVATATAPTSTTTYLNARLAFQNGTSLALASETTFNASVTAAPALLTVNQLRVQWQWGTAASNNAAILHNCALIQGN